MLVVAEPRVLAAVVAVTVGPVAVTEMYLTRSSSSSQAIERHASESRVAGRMSSSKDFRSALGSLQGHS